MKLSLRHLIYFDALCTSGHFGHAAEATHVTQPALSVKIREMEDILGAPLIDRTERPYHPTPYGREVQERVRSILAQVTDLEDSARHRRGLEGPFRLGVIPTVAPYLLPTALRLVRDRLPKLDLHIREATTEVLTQELQEGRLDACILATKVESFDLTQRVLFQDRFVLAVQRQQAQDLNLRDSHISMTDIVPLNLLLLSEGHCLREQTRDICRFASQDVLNQIGASSLHTLVGLVESGYGATLLPEIALDTSMLGGSLVFLRLVSPEPDRTISLVSKASPGLSVDLSALATVFAEAGALKSLESRRILKQTSENSNKT